MALVATQVISRATTGGGLTPTYSAVSASDTFNPGNTVFLHVKNASGSSINATVAIPTGREVISDLPFVASRQYAVAAGSERMVGPFPAGYFADLVTGLVTVTYSATPSVTAAVLSVVAP